MIPRHTPLPWTLERDSERRTIRIIYTDGARKSYVALLQDTVLCPEHGDLEANAALIVTAVNHFAELTATLTALVKVYDKVGGPLAVDSAVDKARALLARLEGTR